MSRTDSLHYRLCQRGAKWLHNGEIKYTSDGSMIDSCKIVAVELVTIGIENPDVWGTNGFLSYIIEVKTSRSDFLIDYKKKCRKKENACGNFRYYLVPKGLLSLKEIPKYWGLLEYDGKNINVIKRPKFIECDNSGDLCMLSSIARREGVKNKIYNYRIPENNSSRYIINNHRDAEDNIHLHIVDIQGYSHLSMIIYQSNEAYIYDLDVNDDLHDKGFGTSILLKAEEVAKTNSVKKIILGCSESLEDWYSKRGYHKINNLDVIYMEKIIKY